MSDIDRFKRRRERRMALRLDTEWNEEDHPRGEDGKFAKTNSSGAKQSEDVPERNKSASIEKSRQSSPFSDSSYSSERKKNANDYTYGSIDYTDYPLKNYPKKDLTLEEQSALEYWTSGAYRRINALARGDEGYYFDDEFSESAELIQSAISKCKIDRDIYLYRELNNISKLFSFSDEELIDRIYERDLDESDMDELRGMLVGAVGRDEGFAACHSTGGFESNKAINVRMYVPKGTEGVYLGDISNVPDEAETLLQRGTAYMCTGIRLSKSGRLEVDVEVIGQNPRGEKAKDFRDGLRRSER